MSNNYGFNEMNRDSHLQGIEQELRGVKTSIKDRTYLEVYGKEAYIEMIEKRRFRQTLIGCGIGSFILGYLLVGLYLNNWSITAVVNKTMEFITNLF